MTAPAIRLDRVSKHFGDFVAVGDFSMKVPAGVIYGVLGPNGAGKTTTLRMINDILAPDSGSIRLFGNLSPGRRASMRIGYLPEERGLYPNMKVAEMLRFFGELRGLAAKEAAQRARHWLERLGIDDWGDNRVQDLSKGMQQKVQFASALIHEPELLILDEPWGGLDPINADVLREIVLEQKQKSRTILFSTHLMEQAEKICDHVCIIARGKSVLEGELDQLKRDAAGDRLVALSFETQEAATTATETVLADDGLVAAIRQRRDHIEIELAPRVEPQSLLERLIANELPVRRFERFEPSLHQIFVDRVGTEAASDKDGRQ